MQIKILHKGRAKEKYGTSQLYLCVSTKYLSTFILVQILSSGRKCYFICPLFYKTNYPSMADLHSLAQVQNACVLHCNHCKQPLCYLYYAALFTSCKMVCQNKILKNSPPAPPHIFLLFSFNLKDLSRLLGLTGGRMVLRSF